MNIENMNKLLSWLKSGAPHVEFDMTVGLIPTAKYFEGDDLIPEGCGSACCLAGAAAMLSGSAKLNYDINDAGEEVAWDEVFESARDWLGIAHYEAEALFQPFEYESIDAISRKRRELTLDDAIAAVEDMINGDIPWEDKDPGVEE